MAHGKNKICGRKQKNMFTKKQMDSLYEEDDKYDKMYEQGYISQHEADLMRKGKYKKNKSWQ